MLPKASLKGLLTISCIKKKLFLIEDAKVQLFSISTSIKLRYIMKFLYIIRFVSLAPKYNICIIAL